MVWMEVSMGGFVVRLYEQTFNFPETISVGFDLKCTPICVCLSILIHTHKKRLPLHTWIIHSSIHLKTRVTSFAMKFHNSFFHSLFFGVVCLYFHCCLPTRKQLQYLWLLHLNINIHLAHIDVYFYWSEIVVCSFVRR